MIEDFDVVSEYDMPVSEKTTKVKANTDRIIQRFCENLGQVE